jgi:hypothetical protein
LTILELRRPQPNVKNIKLLFIEENVDETLERLILV